MRPETAMILAAGFGTRMGALTRARPKPLLPVAGRALIDHALDTAGAAGVRRAVVNLHYLGDLIRAHLAGRTAPEIAFSDEAPAILDTGGGVVRALPLLGPGAFFALNSDAVFAGRNPLDVLAGAWRPERMDALLLLVPVAQARAYTRAGDFFLDAEGGAPRRRRADATAPLVFSGAQILAPSALDDAPREAFSLNLVWDRLIGEGRLAAVTYPDAWVDVGTPEGLAEAERALAAAGA
jgi:N-acetyl-alpha-D-muramate 1-phosphate uridylyltransferase